MVLVGYPLWYFPHQEMHRQAKCVIFCAQVPSQVVTPLGVDCDQKAVKEKVNVQT